MRVGFTVLPAGRGTATGVRVFRESHKTVQYRHKCTAQSCERSLDTVTCPCRRRRVASGPVSVVKEVEVEEVVEPFQ